MKLVSQEHWSLRPFAVFQRGEAFGSLIFTTEGNSVDGIQADQHEGNRCNGRLDGGAEATGPNRKSE